MIEPLWHVDGEALWQRMSEAEQRVEDRLQRVCAALTAANVPYAICGGMAVRAWVAQVDTAAVRTTRDVDVLVNRLHFPKVQRALADAGFVHRHVSGIDMFLQADAPSVRDAVHVVFSGEFVRSEHPTAAPSLEEPNTWTAGSGFPVISLEALVRMKLNAFRDKDRVHLRDMIEVGLLDASWLDRLPAALASRLRDLFEHPE